MSSVRQPGAEIRFITRCTRCDTLLDAQGPPKAQKFVKTEGECWPNCVDAKQGSGATGCGLHTIVLIFAVVIKQITSIFDKI